MGKFNKINKEYCILNRFIKSSIMYCDVAYLLLCYGEKWFCILLFFPFQ
jgi:hypothetical protein